MIGGRLLRGLVIFVFLEKTRGLDVERFAAEGIEAE